MDIIDKIGRLLKEDPQDEYDQLKKQLQAAKEAGNESRIELIRSKMKRLRLEIAGGH